MQLKAHEIAAALAKKLAPVYFISGDEPLQLGEAADAVRRVAKNAGFENREVLTVDASFSWVQLAEAADSFSLFADKKLIDLRIPSGKLGTDGSKALIAYCERLPEDALLLITSARIESNAKKSRWFTVLNDVGVVVQVWPLQDKDIIAWLQQRLSHKGMQLDQQGLRILASQTEGNLLAAVQEIEKLYVLHGAGMLDNQRLINAVTDSSRYNVFKLVDAALSGRLDRVLRILRGLKAEGVGELLVLWALTREARDLRALKGGPGQLRGNANNAKQRWDKQSLSRDSALKRLKIKDLDKVLLLAAKADRQIKGVQAGDAWETLLDMCLVFSAVDVISFAR